MRTTYISPFFLILFLSVTLSNCKPKEKVAPEIIPLETMNLELSYFEQTATTNSYYEKAKIEVQKWIPLLNDSLEFYEQVHEKISEYNFEYQSENNWLINFKDQFNTDNNYEIKYYQIVEADTISPKLFVSKFLQNEDTAYLDLLLMDGSTVNFDTGIWYINKHDTANTSIDFFEIEWHFPQGIAPKIKFTNLQLGGENGNYILYQDSVDANYDSYLSLFNKADDNYTTIEWNKQSNIGRIKDLNLFLDGNWYCWDNNLQNTDCN